MESAMEFIRPELSILVLFLYCVGLFLKLNREFEKEWTIPYILLLISFVMTLAYVSLILGEGITAAVIVAVIIQSVLIAAVAVFGNELIKQLLYKRNECEDSQFRNKPEPEEEPEPEEVQVLEEKSESKVE